MMDHTWRPTWGNPEGPEGDSGAIQSFKLEKVDEVHGYLIFIVELFEVIDILCYSVCPCDCECGEVLVM